jgi:histidinol phosphatase-like enzyme (inositol monophosphatase family)
MMVTRSELQATLDFGVAIAREAGKITLRYFQRAPETTTKADGSFVTIADRETETYLRGAIGRRFPEDAILGEEEGESTGTSRRRWIIDPIDGTFAFVHGVPFYGVLLALEIDGKQVLGIVNVPALNEIVYAASGLGCFCNGRPATVSSTASLEEALLLCTDFKSGARYGFGSAVAVLQTLVKASRTWGDCYGYVLVATGRADVMLDPVMNLWDCAALKPIVEEAGGTFTDWTGAKTANGGNSIATNGKLFEEVMRVINANYSSD